MVRETDAGVVISGRLGMHTSPAYAEDVYVGALNGVQIDGHPASFIVPVGGTGVTTICRKIAARGASRFAAPLRSRFDELDGQMWLDNVFIPWERVFLVEPSPEPIATWLLWHHLYGWLAEGRIRARPRARPGRRDGRSRNTSRPSNTSSIWWSRCRPCAAASTAAERDPAFTAAGILRSPTTRI